MKFDVWDGTNNGLKDGYFIGAKCAIVTFCDQKSADNVMMWINKIENVCGLIPIVLCRTKCDIEEDIILDDRIFHKIISVSTKTCHNFEEPFIYLSERI